ncbi:glutamate-gated chloride channel-like [Penaeus monodon]|uniref:glutamate-gated chloride channel-like n=1 Tax=Penaeus monodon TaxID=6687 RepID=UPI0018A6DE9B|nr:glutamate-gated chloride channel-like [Penaeus monodon]
MNLISPVLLLTICQSHEFTCADGSCIPKTRRCDLSLDCRDKSDESDCDRVLIPEGYSTLLPPPKINHEPVPLHASVLIRTIRSIDVANFKISVDLEFVLKWKDTRLRYRNLQDDRRSNKLNDWQSIWVPSLKITDMTQGNVASKPFNTAAFVIKMAEPVPDDDSVIYEDYMYSGTENYVRFQEEMTVSFACPFDLVMYPFDQQKCYLAFEIHDYDLSLGYFVMEANESRFIGNRRLMEYVLDGERTFVYVDHNASHVAVELKFRNQFLYYVGNVIIPSLMLTILCYITLFFDENDFNDRIMVSLTSLLVLVTLFSDSGKSIPKTAYFKLIDVWFISLIWEDFCIILSIIYIEEVRQASRSSPKAKSTSSIPTIPQSLRGGKERHVRINDIVTWLFAATLLIILAVIIPLGVHGLTMEVEINFKEMV